MKQAFIKSRALKFVLLIGIMSFFADFTYEGARSIIGPYLALLGASAAAVGIITGFGEPLGYGIFWFLGSALLGILYGVSLPALIVFSVVVELAAIPLFFMVRNQARSSPAAR